LEFDVSHALPPRTPAEIEFTLAAALDRVAAELAEVVKALAAVHRQGGGSKMNLNQIIAAFVRGAAWQLMRRSPTWLLIAIVAAAWLLGGHHG
jgi:hypothetical protein